jgi:hypothetical protein
MSRGISKIEILIIIFLALVIIGADIFVYLYLGQKTHDINVISDISQIRSGFEVYLTINNYYPKINEAEALNDSYLGTEKLCSDGFMRITDKCNKVILGSIPNTYLVEGDTYLYKSIETDKNYQLQFSLQSNFPSLGLKKGINCATNTTITSVPCF